VQAIRHAGVTTVLSPDGVLFEEDDLFRAVAITEGETRERYRLRVPERLVLANGETKEERRFWSLEAVMESGVIWGGALDDSPVAREMLDTFLPDLAKSAMAHILRDLPDGTTWGELEYLEVKTAVVAAIDHCSGGCSGGRGAGRSSGHGLTCSRSRKERTSGNPCASSEAYLESLTDREIWSAFQTAAA
jgi:hypothetical protein